MILNFKIIIQFLFFIYFLLLLLLQTDLSLLSGKHIHYKNNVQKYSYMKLGLFL